MRQRAIIYSFLAPAADVVSIIAIVCAFIVLPLWWHYDPTVSNHQPPGSPWPLQFKIFLTDAIPLLIGIIWLTYRYGEALNRKFPFVLTMRFRVLLPIAGFCFVIIMQILWGVKK